MLLLKLQVYKLEKKRHACNIWELKYDIYYGIN